MKYFYPLAMVATLLVASVTSYAADPGNNFCKEVVDSQKVFDCSVYEKARADKELNNLYRNLLERVSSQYKSNRMLGDDYIQRIKSSQRLWIKLRDADCTLEAFQIEAGTLAYETTMNYCVVRMSDKRSRYLERIAPNL